MMQRRIRLSFVVVCLFFLMGCVTPGGEGPKPLSEMTPKEKATWMMGIYNAQARDYKAMVARPDLTNEQKEVLRKKKDVMTQVWPMINTYNAYVDSGAVVNKSTEDQIIKLINDLTAMVMN